MKGELSKPKHSYTWFIVLYCVRVAIMCETEKIEFCEKCEAETPHLISGSGNKRACMICGY